jgi:protein SCO1/2
VARFASFLAALSMAVAVAACGKSDVSFRNSDVTGAGFGGELSLTGHDGKPHSLADFRGKVVVLFFGFTRCPDVCPTTMAEIKSAVDQLGDQAKRVQVLFVTVDPVRDTPEVLSQYVPAFDPSFLGLRGDAAQTAKVAKDFKVYYQKVPGKTPDSYTMDHTAASYVFDESGRLRLFVRPGNPADLAADLKTLLRSG